MFISNVTIPFEKVAEILGLPKTAIVTAIREHHEGAHMVVRVVADVMPSDCFLSPGDPLTKIGESYIAKPADVAVGGSAVIDPPIQVTPEEGEDEELDLDDDLPLGDIVPPTVIS
jgi:hypothetical protein